MYSELKLIEQAVINNQFEVIDELWVSLLERLNGLIY